MAMASEQKPPDEELVARMREGDQRAFETLFRVYYEELCGFVESQIGTSEVSEDLVQNIFLNLWRRRRECEPRTTLRAYLFGAARNESIRYRKHQDVRDQWEEEEKMKSRSQNEFRPSPAEDVEQRQLQKAMQKFVSELPERRREVYVLSRRHGLTYKEIAAVMGISPKTVDNQMVEALKFLRDRLRSYSSEVAV
jgi:RNA polymerase sigma-70 factor (ECF subfamily)